MTTTNPRPEDKLTKSLFHKTMVFFYQPASWPYWAVGLTGGGLAALAGLAWWAANGRWEVGLLGAAILAAFVAADAWLLAGLPRRELSFGPWAGQLFPLALPRWLAMLLWAVVALAAGWPLALGLAFVTQIIGSLALYWGAIVEPDRLAISELALSSPQLPAGSKPLRLLHISDIHLERTGQREQRLLALAAEARPDVIVLTGDYVNLSNNKDLQTHAAVRQLLGNLNAPGGVYAVLGSPPVDLADQIAPLFEDLPVVLLREEVVEIDLGEGRFLTLIGLDCHHDMPHDGARLAALAEQTSPTRPRVLLYHSPELMPRATELGLDLHLCGHTHGGQVRLPLIGPVLTSSQLGRRYVMGHYREGKTHLYVVRGVGFEGLSAPRVRFLCPPEILLVTIAPESHAL